MVKMEHGEIDALLERHAEAEFGRIDCDRLHTTIVRRLDSAGVVCGRGGKRKLLFSIAGGIMAAAAVLLLVVLLPFGGKDRLELKGDQTAAVVIEESKGSAEVEISGANSAAATVLILSPTRGKATVDTSMRKGKYARCEVEIHDLNGHAMSDESKATWIIIRMPADTMANNGINRDEIDILNML